MNTTMSQSDLIRRRILRFHSAFLLVLTSVVTLVSIVGWLKGVGPFGILQSDPFATVGLYQAYLLMFIIGLTLRMGSGMQENLWKWDLIGLLAHVPPLTANFVFAGVFAELNLQMISVGSVLLHSLFILLELFAILYKAPAKL